MSTPATVIQGQTALLPGGEESSTAQAVRRRIQAAAKHKFARFGFDGTLYSDVARSADLSPAELSLYFDSKLDMLMAVFDEGWGEINQRLGDILLSSVNAREAALSMLALMMRILDRDEDLARLLLFESRRPDPESGAIRLSDGYRRFERLCVDLAVRGQKDGSFSASHNPRLIACVMIGAVESLMRSQVIGEQQYGVAPFTPAEVFTAFETLMLALNPRPY
ncbi:MAG: TetR/AcrR family transcriptional regulator [Bacillota bacterium]